MKENRVMKNLSGTAERLRTIRAAQEHFLALFALDCILDQPRPYDRLASDLLSLEAPAEADFPFARSLGDF